MRFGLPSALLYSLIFTATAQAAQYAPFDLETMGNNVCRVDDPAPQDVHCLPTVQSQGSELAPVVEIVDKAKAFQGILSSRTGSAQILLSKAELDAAGGAIMLSKAELNMVIANFSRISFRDLAMNTEMATDPDGRSTLHFYASVQWTGKSGANGTINVSGRFLQITPGAATPADKDANVVQIQKSLGSIVDIQQISDSSTEAKRSYLRDLERFARTIQFDRIGGLSGDTDTRTVEFLQQIVAPVIFGEMIYVPVEESLAKFAGEVINSNDPAKPATPENPGFSIPAQP